MNKEINRLNRKIAFMERNGIDTNQEEKKLGKLLIQNVADNISEDEYKKLSTDMESCKFEQMHHDVIKVPKAAIYSDIETYRRLFECYINTDRAAEEHMQYRNHLTSLGIEIKKYADQICPEEIILNCIPDELFMEYLEYQDHMVDGKKGLEFLDRVFDELLEALDNNSYNTIMCCCSILELFLCIVKE